MAPFLMRIYTRDTEIESRWVRVYWKAIDMLPFLLMMAMGLWWIGVVIVANGLLRDYNDYECPGPTARSQPLSWLFLPVF